MSHHRRRNLRLQQSRLVLRFGVREEAFCPGRERNLGLVETNRWRASARDALQLRPRRLPRALSGDRSEVTLVLGPPTCKGYVALLDRRFLLFSRQNASKSSTVSFAPIAPSAREVGAWFGS